ncbi:MAG: hypothetical protein HWE15_12185 [Algoriphagus sp.]|uniref:hypothetical protein n=1 Tax=Algoriphagus sp. TaxID=1872435 RepID=UPI00185B3332|nr:hypothetical protein [Algoriphagus sp.]NVJ87060.1 hypothetical protein [Algoriphagus sp.]
MRKLFLLFLILFYAGNAFAQKKVEQERRIKKQELPESAVDWLHDAFDGKKKVRWYLENSDKGTSYEAKFIWKNKFHSVEFDASGKIQDVEVELTLQELDAVVVKNLQKYFSESYRDYKIQRIQIQYTGEEEDLEDFFDDEKKDGITVRYEIEYLGKPKDGEQLLWEGLFDDQGKLISKREVEIRIMDNLIF